MVDALWSMLLTLGLWQAHNVLQDLVNDWSKVGLNILPELSEELNATDTLNQLCRPPVLQQGDIADIITLLVLKIHHLLPPLPPPKKKKKQTTQHPIN